MNFDQYAADRHWMVIDPPAVDLLQCMSNDLATWFESNRRYYTAIAFIADVLFDGVVGLGSASTVSLQSVLVLTR